MAARLSALTRENIERLATGRPMKMRRGRLGLWLPGDPPLPLQDIHPARYRSEHVESTVLISHGIGRPWHRKLIHVANEGSGSAKRGKMLKAEGVRPGVHDYLLPMPCHGRHGLWIEMKASDGSAAGEQETFAIDMQAEGYAACFAFGADAAVGAIESYLRTGRVR
jgi:hypothetical protein